jgi:hypothetical protein
MLVALGNLTAAAAPLGGDNGQDLKQFDYVMKINRAAMSAVDGKMMVALNMTAKQDVPAMQSVIFAPIVMDTTTHQQVELPQIFINSRNQQIYFERNLTNEFPNALALQKKRGKDLDIDYLRSVKYEPWMERSVLKLQMLSCACSKPTVRGEETLCAFNPAKKEVIINLYPVYVVPPADNRIKVREEKGSAYLCFVVDKWDIKPDYMSNPAELQKIHNSVNIVKSDSDVTMRKMTIEGYASPEGSYAHNIMLSENRTNALKQYLQQTGVAKNIPLEASGKGENWPGFLKYLKENTLAPQRDVLLRIANSNLSPDEKEKQMRKEAPEGYSYVLKTVFPSLRCTNYTVTYTVRPFTVEESERVFETRPTNLNLNEIYKLAEKYASNQEKYYSIIRKAYMLYPNDSFINLTLSCLAIKKGNADEAAEYLSKVDDCGEKTMNEGIVAYLKGDLDKAIRLVEQAKTLGVRQSAQQLNEFMKLKKK